MAVSSGCMEAGDMAHWVTMDRPVCFPRWVTESDRFEKHVPRGMYQELWRRAPRVRFWDYTFETDKVTFTDPDAPCVRGPLPRNYSLLFAVQIAHKLGYKRLIFVGVDLTDQSLYKIGDVLKQWWWKARDLGLQWENASPLSHLQEWMPDCTSEESLKIECQTEEAASA